MSRIEDSEQIALYHWRDTMLGMFPELETMYHIANEGKRSKAGNAILKAMGLKKGVSDNCLPVKRGEYGSLYIEMKAPKYTGVNTREGKPTKEQLAFIELMKKNGNAACVCYGWAAAAGVIIMYLTGGEIEKTIYRFEDIAEDMKKYGIM